MGDITKEELKKEITAILKDADLTTTSAKKVRQQVEENLSCDLTSRKKEVDDLVMQCLKSKGGKKPGSKKNGKGDDDEENGDEDDDEDDEDGEDEEEEEEEEEKPKRAAKKPAPTKRKRGSDDDDEDDDDDESGSDAEDSEYSPAKKQKAAAKGKAAAAGKGRKKKGSDSDSDEDYKKSKGKKGGGKPAGKRGGGSGFSKQCTLSPELAAVVGAKQMARHEVVKKMWVIIKEKNLADPKNKQFAICNDELYKVFGVKRFRTFGMLKFLKNHFLD